MLEPIRGLKKYPLRCNIYACKVSFSMNFLLSLIIVCVFGGDDSEISLPRERVRAYLSCERIHFETVVCQTVGIWRLEFRCRKSKGKRLREIQKSLNVK